MSASIDAEVLSNFGHIPNEVVGLFGSYFLIVIVEYRGSGLEFDGILSSDRI
jgi:hypothetical protein